MEKSELSAFVLVLVYMIGLILYFSKHFLDYV